MEEHYYCIGLIIQRVEASRQGALPKDTISELIGLIFIQSFSKLNVKQKRYEYQFFWNDWYGL